MQAPFVGSNWPRFVAEIIIRDIDSDIIMNPVDAAENAIRSALTSIQNALEKMSNRSGVTEDERLALKAVRIQIAMLATDDVDDYYDGAIWEVRT